jgi:hypothetical protein
MRHGDLLGMKADTQMGSANPVCFGGRGQRTIVVRLRNAAESRKVRGSARRVKGSGLTDPWSAFGRSSHDSETLGRRCCDQVAGVLA